MSIYTAPHIVTDGLVLALDTANTKSFRGEPTTNVLSISDWNTMGGSWQAPYWVTVDRSIITDGLLYGGVNIIKGVIQSTGSGGVTYIDQALPTGASAGIVYACSVWFKSTTRTSMVYCHDTTNASASYGTNQSADGNWNRATVIFTSTTSGYVRLHVGFNGGSIGDIVYFTAPQIEQKSYVTAYVNGTRGTTFATGGGWADLSGYGNHGSLFGGVTYLSTYNGNLLFDGTSGKITTSLSIEAASNSNLQTFSGWLIGDGNIFGSNADSTGKFHLSIGLVSNTLIFYVSYYGGVGGENNDSVSVTSKAANNIVAVKTAPYLFDVYFNSIKVINQTTKQAIYNSQFAPGMFYNSQFTYGQVSNYLIYNRALSQSEITQNYIAMKSRYNLA